MDDSKDQKGLTLFELMIVVAIISIMFSIAIVSYSSFLRSTRITICHANQITIESARAYNKTINASYAHSLKDLSEVFRLINYDTYGSSEELFCPSGGNYTFVDNSPEIYCSVEGHN